MAIRTFYEPFLRERNRLQHSVLVTFPQPYQEASDYCIVTLSLISHRFSGDVHLKERLAVQIASISALFAIGCSQAYSAIPNMVCSETSEIFVPLRDLETESGDKENLYRISDSKLYVSSPTSDETFYNVMEEIELERRYTSGHRVLVFDLYPPEFTNGVILYIGNYNYWVDIAKIHCTLTD